MSVLDRLYAAAQNPQVLMTPEYVEKRKFFTSAERVDADDIHLAYRIMDFLCDNRSDLFFHRGDQQVRTAVYELHQKCCAYRPEWEPGNFIETYFEPIEQPLTEDV